MSSGARRAVTRASIAVVLCSAAGLSFAGGAQADLLPPPPAPLPSVPAPALPIPTPSLPGAVTAPAPAPALPSVAVPSAPAAGTPTGGLLPVKVDVNVPILKQAPTPPSAPLPAVSTPKAPAELTGALIQVSTGVKSALDQVGAATAGTPLAFLNASGATARTAAVTADLSPLATTCVQATGTGTALANVDLSVLGQDAGTPLTSAFPGFLDACPAGTGAGNGTGNGTVPAPGTGSDTIVSTGAGAGSLVGACARVTTSVAPVESTVVVLDQDLIASLTKAGLPLDQLIVPCPADATSPTGGGSGGSTGGSTGGGDNGGSGSAGGSTGGNGAGGSSSAASDLPSLGGSLPFTGAQVSLFLVLASALLAGGAALVAKARRGGLAAIRLS